MKQAQNSVSALRERLHDSERRLIVTEESGYRICVGEDQLDSLRFAALLADSRRHAADGRLDLAIGMIRSALALWREPALDGLGGTALSGRAARLDEQRLGALELCARWRLEGGQHQEVVDELSDLVPSHPLREGACMHSSSPHSTDVAAAPRPPEHVPRPRAGSGPRSWLAAAARTDPVRKIPVQSAASAPPGRRR
ncbi:AfsR/SARP family transcriptional regulator [Streptomyces microflavus]|uniref:AfsR/SARP family transcriptional regulator n=1 Tax=Streptomyces microflavus TaxID=1919 RepID=UPI0033A18E04